MSLNTLDRSLQSNGSTVEVPLSDGRPCSGTLPNRDSAAVVLIDAATSQAVHSASTGNPFLFPEGLLRTLACRPCGDDPQDRGRMSSRMEVAAATGSPLTEETAADETAAGHPRWWLIHTKPRQEKKLAEQLKLQLLPHYLPATKWKAITRGRTRVTRAPLFSGYLFLWANSAQRRTALETNRIVATHRVEDQSKLSEQLWTLADLIEKGVPLRVEERLAAGQHVRVKAGILKDKQGTIIKRGGLTRLFVFVSELLGGVSLEIDQCLLEPY